ncbi:uncharacterized protein C2845_PM01G36700 [Panicum miliaceum]|uniref:Aminotransferase-like plant mobile domain-containing protein n=1 Tax=Panicum miliaceum TaxID=4540 RepID=A0A3L6TG09_PANMI|nr:uncharacterized protein C2845_PM01G36700 [Panicum miliaceum]
MAAGGHPLVEESTVPMASVDDPSRPCVRPDLFLRPRAGDGAPLPAPPGDPGSGPARVRAVQAEFRGWACVPRRWREWVAKLRPRHEALWRELGILGAVLASTCRVRRRKHERALLQLAAFWSGATGTFVFPWGEATVTLEDVAALAGLPLLGGPPRAPVSGQLEKDVGAIQVVLAVLNRSKKKKASYGGWVKHFLERAPEKEKEASAAAGAGEARDLVEHGAFLAMWLSFFVLPAPPFNVVRREVFPIAARLARGQSVALAPTALASIYQDLSALKHHISSGKEKELFVASAPVHIVQLWVWERFPQLRPEPVSSPAPGNHDMPRAARWHDVAKRFSSKHAHAVFMSPKEFEWRPYGSCSFFSLPPETGGSWVRSQDIATSEALLSFARCLHACELVGMNCIQLYSPHRVARQLGFGQDIPTMVPCASSDWEKAWDTYNIEAESSAFIVPNHKPGVTVQYERWWKPYSSASGTAVSNAAKMKERRDFLTPVKRKMEGVPATNSGKKLHVDTATRGQPPHIPTSSNVYPSHSSASQAARRRAAAVPGFVLRACPPHLRSRAMPATAATGMPQPASDASNDPLDHIPLSERLNSITKMPKQHFTECLVKGGDQEQNVGIQSFIPRSASVGSNKEVLHKDVGQALADAVSNTAIVVDGSSDGPVNKKAQGICFQQGREENLNISSKENNSGIVYCDVLPPNIAPGAVSAGSSEVIGAGTEVDMLPTHEDFLVISDDDGCDKSSGKECEVNAVLVKSVGNKDTQLVDAGNDMQDSQVLEKMAAQRNHANIVEISDDDLDEEASKEDMVFDEATSKEDGLGTMHMHLKSPKIEATWSILQEPNEEKQLVDETNDEQDNLVVKEVMIVKKNSRDCELGSVPNSITLRQEQDLLTHAATLETNDGLLEGPTEELRTCIVTGEIDNTDKVSMEKIGSLDCNEKGNEGYLVSNQDLESPMEDSTGANRNISGIRISETANLRSKLSEMEITYHNEPFLSASFSFAGDSERPSSRMLDGNTELISSEVCTKTLYYLSRSDRVRDAWDKDANSTGTDQDIYLPRRAVGTMEMIKKASAIRHAEIAELKKMIHNLKEEILMLEGA